MKRFKKIKNERIIKKETYTIQAKENEKFLAFLKPEEAVSVCSCLVKTKQTSQMLITGVRYPRFDWEHVLVRTENRYPTFREMIFAKELFWEENEIAFQIFPPESEKVNHEKYTLHLWRDSSIQPMDEKTFNQCNYYCNTIARKKFKGTFKSELIKDDYGKRVVVYGAMHWPTWEELVIEKEKRLGKESAAVQLFTLKSFDDNAYYTSIIWDAKNFRRPPKELV